MPGGATPGMGDPGVVSAGRESEETRPDRPTIPKSDGVTSGAEESQPADSGNHKIRAGDTGASGYWSSETSRTERKAF